jgi:hypothetical protein
MANKRQFYYLVISVLVAVQLYGNMQSAPVARANEPTPTATATQTGGGEGECNEFFCGG